MDIKSEDFRQPRYVFVIIMALLSLLSLYFLKSHRILFGQGSIEFLSILLDPAVASSKHNKITGLLFFFGLPFYVAPVIALFFCLRACRHHDPKFLLFPIISFFVTYQSTSMHVVSSYWLAACLFWPTFFYILFRKNQTPRHLTLIVLTAGLSLSGTWSFLLCLILLAALKPRWAEAVESENGLQKVNVALLGIVASFGALVGPYDLLFTNSGSWQDFKDVHKVFGHGPFWINLAILASTLCLAFSDFASSKKRVVFRVLFFAFGFYLAFWANLYPENTFPALAVQLDAMSVIVPAILGFLAFLSTREEYEFNLRFYFPGPTVLAWCLFLISFQLTMTEQWNSYERKVVRELKRLNGVAPFEMTDFRHNPIARQFYVGNEMPTQSVIFAAIHIGEIKTIIENESFEEEEPFSPNDPEEWPDLAPFGVPNRVTTQ
jgi:hypothetical protein